MVLRIGKVMNTYLLTVHSKSMFSVSLQFFMKGKTMNRIYPMIIHDQDGFWGEFPDIDGCNVQGDTLLELLHDAKGALEAHLLSMLMDGEPLPHATSLKTIQTDSVSYPTLITAEIDLAKEDKSVKKTLTLPRWLNEQAEKQGINFSRTLQEALIEKMQA